MKKAKEFFFLSVIGPILNPIFTIYLLVFLDLGAIGRISWILLTKIIIFIYCFKLFKQYTTYEIDFKLFKKSVHKAFPLILASYFYIPIFSLDRLFLERIGNTSELGIYSIGAQVAGFMSIAFTALFQAFEPDIYKCINNNNYIFY